MTNKVLYEKDGRIGRITLNRPDVFPVTDLGVKKGFQHYYKLSDIPVPVQMLKKSEKWAPYRTVVSLYFWRLLEGPFEW